MCLANYVHPKKVIVGPEKLYTDATLSQVEMRRTDPQQLLTRYGILKALPPHDILDEGFYVIRLHHVWQAALHGDDVGAANVPRER